MFFSPGYGSNDTLQPQIQMTHLSNRPDTYLHELRHGLHLKVCNAIFERREISPEAFRLFCETILGDEKFIQQIEQRGSALQKNWVKHAYELQKNGRPSPVGALTYQHAYFVDPRMCEVAASFMDTGITRVIGDINRVMTTMIPGDSRVALKGYGDKKSQSMFEQSDLFHKALLVKRDDYRREQFFKPKE